MALDFNQGGGAVAALELLSAPVTTYPISMACWVNASQYTSNAQVLITISEYNGAGLQDYFVLGLDGTLGTKNVLANKKTGFVQGSAVSGSIFPLDTWFHAGARWNSATDAVAFFNGVPGAVDATNLTPFGLDSVQLFGLHTFSGYTLLTRGCGLDCGIWADGLPDSAFAAMAAGYSAQRFPLNRVMYAPVLSNLSKTINLSGPALTAVTSGGGSFGDCPTGPQRIGRTRRGYAGAFQRRFWMAEMGPVRRVA